LVLAVYDYADRDALTSKNAVLEILGMIFTGVFTLELVLKVIANGFIVHSKSYFREGWNIIDIIVVISG
jgi:voltage-dependent calcium channel L type alpha-1D